MIQLVLNFQPRAADGTALLQFDDVGSSLPRVRARPGVRPQPRRGATPTADWIELDFVEAPSQIMEHWAWSPDMLQRIGRHHRTGEPPPDALLERLPDVRRLNIGTYTLWFFMFRTLVDQYLHGPDEVDPADAYRRAIAVTGFPFPEGTFQPASFDHIMASIYDAGFYSPWAQVFGDDMFSAFRDDGLLSSEVGRRYRREILDPAGPSPAASRSSTSSVARPPTGRSSTSRHRPPRPTRDHR